MLTRALAIALAVVMALALVQTLRLNSEKADRAQERQRHLAALVTAVQEARDEEQRRAAAIQEQANEARKREDQARADAGAARTAGERLRQQLAVARASVCGDPAPASTGTPADTTERLFAELQRRLDEAQDRVAEFADRAHIAGLTCQRSYDALSQ